MHPHLGVRLLMLVLGSRRLLSVLYDSPSSHSVPLFPSLAPHFPPLAPHFHSSLSQALGKPSVASGQAMETEMAFPVAGELSAGMDDLPL